MSRCEIILLDQQTPICPSEQLVEVGQAVVVGGGVLAAHSRESGVHSVVRLCEGTIFCASGGREGAQGNRGCAAFLLQLPAKYVDLLWVVEEGTPINGTKGVKIVGEGHTGLAPQLGHVPDDVL